MTTVLGAPFIPPDDVLLSINSTTGALQLKPGTQGDILYAGAAGAWAKLGTGTDGQLLKAQGAGANPTWATVSAPTLLGTLSPSNVATIDSAALTAYARYIVVVKGVRANAGDTDLRMRLGSAGTVDTGNNYDETYMNNTTNTVATNGGSILIGGINQNFPLFAIVEMAGVSGPTASGRIGVAMRTSMYQAGTKGLSGAWSAGNATQLNIMRFFASANFTGTIEIYGVA